MGGSRVRVEFYDGWWEL